jgi:DNA-binding CsgD family transcriptional regulator
LWLPLLSGVALWTWLLAFLFFGPVLDTVFGSSGDVVGYVFAAGHMVGLVFWANDSRRSRLGFAFLALLIPLTLWELLAPPIALALPLAAVGGFGSACAVLRWLRLLQRAAQPGLALALAAGLANVFVWLLSLPIDTQAFTRLAGGVLVVLAIGVAAVALRDDGAAGEPGPLDRRERRWRPPLHLLLFAVAAYVAGGVLFGTLSYFVPRQPVAAWIGEGPYIVAFVLAAGWTRPTALTRLQTWTLAVIGVGAVFLAAFDLLPWDFTLAWTLVMAGLGLADAYYWRSAIALFGSRGALTAGVALAWNVFIVSGTALATQFLPGLPLARMPIAGVLIAIVLFALGPWLSAATARRREAAPQTLTRSEAQVLELLLKGLTDADIAEELHISRNTVKFHVRNVLHKTGHANRRDLRRSHTALP